MNDSLTKVYVMTGNENLLYKRPDTSHIFYSQMRVHYELLAESSHKVTDSSTYYMYDAAAGEHVKVKNIFSEFAVTARSGNVYALQVDLWDMNRRAKYTKTIVVNKQDRSSAQNFLVTRRDSIAFNSYFNPADVVRIRCADATVSRLNVDIFAKETLPAPPPFSSGDAESELRADSTYIVPRTANGFTVRLPEKGFCRMRPDATGGISLSVFDPYFPAVGSEAQMIDCARYIMSRDEYNACKSAPDSKEAIDKFWLNIGGSNERARELLKRYYGRVKEANKHFTSYVEGWKTDRGMIFVIFGQPANVYKSRKDEVWAYGNEANPAALRFVFNKVKSAYSDNDFRLERSPFYKDPWYVAVDSWRQGHVYENGRR